MSNKSILFLSTANLTTNPRLYKELLTLEGEGYKVFLIGFDLGNWSCQLENRFLKRVSAESIYISALRRPIFPWLLSTIVQKICIFIYPIFRYNKLVNAFASNKRTLLLVLYLYKLNREFDLIISHNLGTLYPAYIHSKRKNIPFAFDIEDYHPGEKIDKDINNEQSRRKLLLQELLPEASYISYASPLIGKHVFNLLPDRTYHHILINNCFLQYEFDPPKSASQKIKFVWFSQYIDIGRGLEMIIPILNDFANQIELHLIGETRKDFYNSFIRDHDYIYCYAPMLQDELHRKLSEFDVGLALESPEQDFNRDICLTNKIFAYAQAGLFILATDTQGQTEFISRHSSFGKLFNQDSITDTIKCLIDNIGTIQTTKMKRYTEAKSLSWENEKGKLIGIVNEVINATIAEGCIKTDT